MSEILPPLSAERNDRACKLILRSIAGYPQSTANEDLVADNVLRSYENPARKGVTFGDLAAIDPMAYDRLEPDVHRVHKAFGIPSRPRAAQIALHVVQSAKNAIIKGYDETAEAYWATDRPLPEGLRKVELFDDDSNLNPWLGVVLHETLQDDPEVTGLVISSVRNYARRTRRNRVEQRRGLVRVYST